MAGQDQADRVCLLLSDDLMFTSRIVGTAADLGFTVKPAKAAEALIALAAEETPRCVIVDLSNPTLEISRVIGQLRAPGLPAPRIVAYGSHVDTAKLQAAREAGCNVVLSRSRFVGELPKSLPDWMGQE
jgi:CheY-like chemotaxis protein